jgi:hypothetical protein
MERLVWLYSGAVSGWWCYDDENIIQLNKMYTDFCNKKILQTTPPIEIKKFNNITSDLVNFSDDDSVGSVSTTISNLSNKSNIKKYIIKTQYGNYKIDFDLMVQINVGDIKKRRNITFLKISENIFNNVNTLKKYLMDNGVKGVSGNTF